jgi:hypothetical protein
MTPDQQRPITADFERFFHISRRTRFDAAGRRTIASGTPVDTALQALVLAQK